MASSRMTVDELNEIEVVASQAPLQAFPNHHNGEPRFEAQWGDAFSHAGFMALGLG